MDSGTILGLLITGSLGFFALVYAFFVWQKNVPVDWFKAVSSYHKTQAWNKLKHPSSHHTWINDVASGRQPFTCCACFKTISTLVHRCSVCGVAAHSHCSQFAAKDCKCVAQSGSRNIQHHWSDRWFNLDENPEMCFYCDKTFGIPSINAPPPLFCLWCRRTIHANCQAIMSEEYGSACDLGVHRSLILSPLYVKSEEFIASTQNLHLNKRCISCKGPAKRALVGLKKYTIQDLPSDDRPLLVFLNIAQNGAVLQRHLNMLLNPVQVIQLTSSQGPEVGLELFSNVQYFRVLVCGEKETVARVLDAVERCNYESPPPVVVLPPGTGNNLSGLSTFLCELDNGTVERVKVVTSSDSYSIGTSSYGSYTSNSEEEESSYSSSSSSQVSYTSSSESEGCLSYKQPTCMRKRVSKHPSPKNSSMSHGMRHAKHFGAWKKLKERLKTVFHHHHRRHHGASSPDKRKGEVMNDKEKEEGDADKGIETAKKCVVRGKKDHSHLHSLVGSLLRHIRHSKKLKKSGQKSDKKKAFKWWKVLQHHRRAKLHNKTHNHFLTH